MALVQWLKDNPVMSQYIAGGTRDQRARLHPEVPLSPEHEKFVRSMGVKNSVKSRPKTKGDAIMSAPDLREAYAPAKLAEEPYGS